MLKVKKTAPVRKATLKRFDGLANQERLQLEYQKVIEEERVLTPILRLDKLTELAMRRYYSTLVKWNTFMD